MNVNINKKLSTLESTLKTDFKDQLTKRDNEIDRKFESLRQKVEVDAMTAVDDKLDTWKSSAGAHRAKMETRFNNLETARDAISDKVNTLQTESSTEECEKKIETIAPPMQQH